MSIEIDLPKDIELAIKSNKDLEMLVRKRIERQISEDLRKGIFLSMLFDDILKDSEISDEEIDEIDHKIKKGIMERLGWM